MARNSNIPINGFFIHVPDHLMKLHLIELGEFIRPWSIFLHGLLSVLHQFMATFPCMVPHTLVVYKVSSPSSRQLSSAAPLGLHGCRGSQGDMHSRSSKVVDGSVGAAS